MEGQKKLKTTIPLTGTWGAGRFLTIDLEDSKRMMAHPWTLDSAAGKAYTYIDGAMVYAHRFILGITDKSLRVAVLNDNPFDLRKSNLKVTASRPTPEHVKPGKVAHHREVSYHNVYKNKDGKYAVWASRNYVGYTPDLKIAAFMADAWLVYDSKGWDKALKSGLLNCPENKEKILAAIENLDFRRFSSLSRGIRNGFHYPCMYRVKDGFHARFTYDGNIYETSVLPTEDEAADALNTERIKRMGIKKSFRFILITPWEMAKARSAKIKTSVPPESKVKPEVPPVVPGGNQPQSPISEQICGAERYLHQFIASLPSLPDELNKAIEGAAETIAKMIYKPLDAEKKFVDRGPGNYVFDNADRIRELMEQIMDLGYFIGKMKPCVVVQLKKV